MGVSEVSNTLVVSMGVGTVFVGLISLIILCTIMGYICKMFNNKPASAVSTPVTNSPAVSDNTPIMNKQEILAAACAVIAEEIGTEANNIKVVSFKRV